MSEERAAAAALAIERYIAGLRHELGPLGAAEAGDLTREISDMLLDAAREDPELAFSEMQRLGEPSQLAATLLAERGIAIGGGIPAAAWWRLGIAATTDVLVGVAAPVLVGVLGYGPVARALSGQSGPGASTWSAAGIVAAVTVLVAFSVVLTWRMWSPWRDGGRSSTPGMALARIAVVRIGGTRAVVASADLTAAGLEAPAISALSLGTALASVIIAVLLIAWSGSTLAGGAPAPTDTALVWHLAGTPSAQREQVTRDVQRLYGAASNQMRSWPALSAGIDSDAFRSDLLGRFGRMGDNYGGAGYTIAAMANAGPGAWTVDVDELPPGSPARRVTLTYTLRVEWKLDGDPDAVWVLVRYAPAP